MATTLTRLRRREMPHSRALQPNEQSQSRLQQPELNTYYTVPNYEIVMNQTVADLTLQSATRTERPLNTIALMSNHRHLSSRLEWRIGTSHI